MKPLDGKIEQMLDNLKRYHIILASNSPRRHELLKGIGVEFEIKTLPNLDESYPEALDATEVAKYLADKKSHAYLNLIQENELFITADTVVVVEGRVLGKPKNREEAVSMLQLLSGKIHHVFTGVCILTKDKKVVFDSVTAVHFSCLTDKEINYYVDHYKPFDKAGAYGVQEWIGYIAVERMEGSYFNVMGLPVQKLYGKLKSM